MSKRVAEDEEGGVSLKAGERPQNAEAPKEDDVGPFEDDYEDEYESEDEIMVADGEGEAAELAEETGGT